MVDATAGAPDPTTTDAPLEMLRSEERLRLATRSEVTGRVRIGKRVVTEERVVTVTVRREELFVEELPVEAGTQHHVPQLDADDPDPARRDAGPVVELLLSEEEVEVSTRVVPRERVRVFVDTITGSSEVSETVDREVIEVDGPPAQTPQT